MATWTLLNAEAMTLNSPTIYTVMQSKYSSLDSWKILWRETAVDETWANCSTRRSSFENDIIYLPTFTMLFIFVCSASRCCCGCCATMGFGLGRERKRKATYCTWSHHSLSSHPQSHDSCKNELNSTRTITIPILIPMDARSSWISWVTFQPSSPRKSGMEFHFHECQHDGY